MILPWGTIQRILCSYIEKIRMSIDTKCFDSTIKYLVKGIDMHIQLQFFPMCMKK